MGQSTHRSIGLGFRRGEILEREMMKFQSNQKVLIVRLQSRLNDRIGDRKRLENRPALQVVTIAGTVVNTLQSPHQMEPADEGKFFSVGGSRHCNLTKDSKIGIGNNDTFEIIF